MDSAGRAGQLVALQVGVVLFFQFFALRLRQGLQRFLDRPVARGVFFIVITIVDGSRVAFAIVPSDVIVKDEFTGEVKVEGKRVRRFVPIGGSGQCRGGQCGVFVAWQRGVLGQFPG